MLPTRGDQAWMPGWWVRRLIVLHLHLPEGKGKGLGICYSAVYINQTRDLQQRFTISEVAANRAAAHTVIPLSSPFYIIYFLFPLCDILPAYICKVFAFQSA